MCVFQVHMACIERCISIEKRPEADLRADLKEWLALSRPIAITTTTASSTGGSSNDDSSNHSIQMKTNSKSLFHSLFTSNSRSVVPNLQNRRLALMALHSVRNLRKSSFSTVYKALFTTTTTGISKDFDEV